jgi:hypothetical protein
VVVSVRTRAAVLAAVVMAACAGGSTAPTSDTTAVGDPAKLVQLDAGNFEALVLATARPAVVEFHSPT